MSWTIVLFAIDQCGPVEPGLGDRDAMLGRPLDLVQRVACGDQHLLRRAAAIWTGAAEIRASTIATESPAPGAGP